MAVVEVPETLEYRGAGQRKPERQWTADERKLAKLRFSGLQKSHHVDFQDSPDDEEDTEAGTQRFSNAKATAQTECHKCGKKGHFVRDCWSKTLVPSYQSPFQPKLIHSSKHKPESRHTKDFEAKYNKIKAKLALLNSNASAPSSSSCKNKGLIVETYYWDEEEVSYDDNEATKVKALMALTDKERVSVGNESANNGEWIKISIEKNNLMSKHRNLVQELNTCEEQLLVLEQAMLDLLTMQHVNTEILKDNQNLRNQLKELSSITEAWLNSSSKVNKCISEQIATQKRKILGIDQLTKDTSSFGPKDLVFIKSSADNSEVSITSSNKPKLSKTEDSTLSNHDTGKHRYDAAMARLLEPYSGSKTIKSILKSKSTFKAETLKGITINEPFSAPARGKKSSLVSKTNSAPAGKLKRIISLRRGIKPRNPQHITQNCKTCGSNVHTTSDHNDIEWFKKREALQAKKAESFKARKTESLNALRSKTPTKRPKKDNETIEYGCNIDSKITSDACQLLEGKLTAKRVDQQATSDPTSLGVTSEARANSQLSSALPTTEANPENSAPRASSVASQIKEETSSTIKLEDLANLVSHVQPSFKDLDSPEDDHVIVVADSDEDEDDESSQVQELTNQVLILQSQKYKLELEKNKAEAALLKAQPSFPNVEQLKELLFDELTEEVKRLKKQVHELEIELPGDLKEIPTKMEDFTKTITRLTSQVASLTLDALPDLLLNVTKALNKFAQVLDSVSSKAGDQSVPLVGQANTRPAEGEKTQIKQPSLSFFK
ncbi:retrovirus-related pol polyprotein from transposon TNT 1-94 [Tanacetum coccineum]|uniref:Retrovirus-related pol polyprotein from transposon TNT 1-94 n=1 Tax=Tanacetum coccineum TaxID=301880 RepID=A0ABQ5I9Z2_9ASTR